MAAFEWGPLCHLSGLVIYWVWDEGYTKLTGTTENLLLKYLFQQTLPRLVDMFSEHAQDLKSYKTKAFAKQITTAKVCQ